MREMAEGIALAYQLTCKVEYTRLLDVTINHPEPTHHAQGAAAAIVGEANVKELTPIMAGEDFGGFLLERPGAFMAIGQAEAGSASPHSQNVHSPFYDFNDAIIPTAASYFAELAERRLPID